jgi:hypothetical protein
MYVKHLSADMRLHRADQLLRDLAAMEAEYLESDALRVEAEPEGGGTPTRRIRVLRPPPSDVAAVASEAVRATREALDQLAVSMSVASRRAPRDTTFPIAAGAAEYPDHEARCLRHTNRAARAAIRSVCPWRGGDDQLWELHTLASAPGSLVVRLGEVVRHEPVPVPSVLHVLQADSPRLERCRPLADLDVLAGADPGPGGPAGARAGLRLVLVAGELVRGRPAVPAIGLLVAHAREVVDEVVARVEHRPG